MTGHARPPSILVSRETIVAHMIYAYSSRERNVLASHLRICRFALHVCADSPRRGVGGHPSRARSSRPAPRSDARAQRRTSVAGDAGWAHKLIVEEGKEDVIESAATIHDMDKANCGTLGKRKERRGKMTPDFLARKALGNSLSRHFPPREISTEAR
jgi:hypothetical protein